MVGRKSELEPVSRHPVPGRDHPRVVDEQCDPVKLPADLTRRLTHGSQRSQIATNHMDNRPGPLSQKSLSLAHSRIQVPAQHHDRIPGLHELPARHPPDTMGRPRDYSNAAQVTITPA